ncbi:MAG: hypothetical protein PHI72_08030 [Atribacterota bacterium]|nr:hypothetical protein [Atribacterota bacterium]MDD5637976.1 hypothetical protein [Atribacterota bacterium]
MLNVGHTISFQSIQSTGLPVYRSTSQINTSLPVTRSTGYTNTIDQFTSLPVYQLRQLPILPVG